MTDRINYEVQEAFERVREADEVVKLCESKVLPAAEANVKEAKAAYTNNKIPFLRGADTTSANACFQGISGGCVSTS